MECDAREVNLHTSDLDELDWSSEIAHDLFYHSRGFSGRDDSVVLRTSDLADSDNSSNDEDKFGDKMFTLPTPAPKETHDVSLTTSDLMALSSPSSSLKNESLECTQLSVNKKESRKSVGHHVLTIITSIHYQRMKQKRPEVSLSIFVRFILFLKVL